MAFRYEHPDGPEYGHCIELSNAEYIIVLDALRQAFERASKLTESDDPSEAGHAANDENDLATILNDMEPMND